MTKTERDCTDARGNVASRCESLSLAGYRHTHITEHSLDVAVRLGSKRCILAQGRKVGSALHENACLPWLACLTGSAKKGHLFSPACTYCS